MSIKMRHSKGNATCCSCGMKSDNALGMYDIKIGDHVLTICDVCNGELLSKSLSAEVEKNSRTKTGHDMAVIRQRHNGTYTKGGVEGGRPATGYSIQYDA